MERIKSFKDFLMESKIEEAMVPVTDLNDKSYTNLKLGDVPKYDKVNKALLDDIETAARIAKIRVKLTAAKSDHPSAGTSKNSTHKHGQGVDLAKIGYLRTNFDNLPGSGGASSKKPVVNREFYDCGNLLVDALINDLGYKIITDDPKLQQKYKSSLTRAESSVDRCIIWQSNVGGNHYNHVHVSSKALESIVKVNPGGKPVASDKPTPSGTPITPGGPISDEDRNKLTVNLTGKKDDNYVNPLTGATGGDHKITGFGELLLKAFSDTSSMGGRGYYS